MRRNGKRRLCYGLLTAHMMTMVASLPLFFMPFSKGEPASLLGFSIVWALGFLVGYTIPVWLINGFRKGRFAGATSLEVALANWDLVLRRSVWSCISLFAVIMFLCMMASVDPLFNPQIFIGSSLVVIGMTTTGAAIVALHLMRGGWATIRTKMDPPAGYPVFADMVVTRGTAAQVKGMTKMILSLLLGISGLFAVLSIQNYWLYLL